MTPLMIKGIKASLALSILDSLRQRSLSVEAAAEITGIEMDRMRALVERREFGQFGLDELADILEAVDSSAPRYGGKL